MLLVVTSGVWGPTASFVPLLPKDHTMIQSKPTINRVDSRSRAVRLRLSQKEASASSSDETASEDDEEFHPSDQAETTIQFLAGLWQLIAQGNSLVRGVRLALLFPPLHIASA